MRSPLLALAALLAIPALASAATLNVNSTADTLVAGDGQCTLREAINNANGDSDTTGGDCTAGSGADLINVPAGTYQQEHALWIKSELTLRGAGAAVTGLVGDPSGTYSWVFIEIDANGPVNLERLKITGGRCFSVALENWAALTISESVVSGTGTAGCNGGAAVSSYGPLTVRRSAVVDNSVEGIFARGSLLVVNSTISGNRPSSYCVGLSGCTCRATSAAIDAETSALLVSSTIADNSIDTSACTPVALWAVLGNSSFIFNYAEQSVFSNPGLRIGNLGSRGYNISSDRYFGSGGTDLSNVDPLLGPLQNNGGPTPTHALLRGSPAIDLIPTAACGYDDDGDPDTPDVPLTQDQRGEARPREGNGAPPSGCDVGAYEVTACADGLDNDGDGRIDFDGGATAGITPLTSPDPNCGSALGNSEAPPPPRGCGLGPEVVPVLLLLRTARRRSLPRVFPFLPALAVGSFLAGPAQALTRGECLALATLALPHTTIASARFVPAGALPARCRVLGTIETEIHFELLLPATTWNAKLYHQGGGGFVGFIPTATSALERGYATVATDTGHVGGDALDASWALDRPDRQLNFAHRAIHLVTQAAQQIVTAAYGRGPLHSYFQGCSNGGRQALMEAQRYPTDFDGIIAGAPALDFAGLYASFNFDQHATAVAPISPSELALIAASVRAQCDAKDGVTDGLVDNPRRCNFDPALLACLEGDGVECLTRAQVEAVQRIYGGAVSAAGEQIYPGFPPGAEDGEGGWQRWITGPSELGAPFQLLLNGGFLRFFVFSDPAYDPSTFDLERDLARIEDFSDLLDATDPDLSAFRAGGGRLILWHGWADPALTAYRTVQYYDDVIRAMGNRHEAEEFVRLFLAPGMHHCEGGPGLNRFDALTALERWVEAGIAPDAIVADHAGTGVPRTRPLCAYPRIAVYAGRGDIDDAAHFTCKLRGLGYSLKGFESGQ